MADKLAGMSPRSMKEGLEARKKASKGLEQAAFALVRTYSADEGLHG
jgi:hypothetical protein